MIVEKLRQFGLDEKEISVYLALISLGPASVRSISAKSGVNRGTTYDILRSLKTHGLVAYFQKKTKDTKKQYFVAEPPDKIVTAIEKRIADLGSLKESIHSSLPELESLYEKSGAKPVVKYYEGSAGIRMILQDVLVSVGNFPEKHYYAYSSADIKSVLYDAYPHFNRDRLRMKITVQVISIGRGGELAGMDERKWLSTEQSSPTYVIIYAGKVAMLSVSASGEPVGVIIEDQGLFETQKMIFEFNWNKL